MEHIKIGSCFSGIGGFELGIEKALPNTKTVWQIEQNNFCQKILQKHYPHATIYSDIKEIKNEKLHTIEPVQIIIGGFPCQDISQAGLKKGIEHGKKSSLWKDMFRIIEHQRPFLVILENVKALLTNGRGMQIVIQDLQKVYDCIEWTIVSAREMGAPHLRERVFIIGYNRKPNTTENPQMYTNNQPSEMENKEHQISEKEQYKTEYSHVSRNTDKIIDGTEKIQTSYPNMPRFKKQPKRAKPMEKTIQITECRSSKIGRIHQRNYWKETPIEPPLCDLDDGVPNRLARLRVLGNAIVPQCSEYIGRLIYQSGILEPLYDHLTKGEKHE